MEKASEASTYLPDGNDDSDEGSQNQSEEAARRGALYLDDSSFLAESTYCAAEDEIESNSESKYVVDGDEDEDEDEDSGTKSEEPAPPVEVKKRDWIGEVDVDASLDSFFSSQAQWGKLADVYEDFKSCARHFGRTIIAEMHLPDDAKTIKPISLGGVAGGRKYIHANMLFKVSSNKFAEDAQLSDGSFLYGGDAPDLHKANKACGHEVKSCGAFALAAVELGVSHLLRVPLMALVRFRGSCLVALSLLPLSKESLVLGSNNGHSCVNTDVEAETLTGLVCSCLGLKPHRVHDVVVPACGDLEVHRGTDNRLYVLDFARVLPPEGPAEHCKLGRKVFYELLRPEAVRLWSTKNEKLVSDAYSGWGRSDPDWKEHNLVCRRAGEYMRGTLVDEAAKFLNSLKCGTSLQSDVIPLLRSLCQTIQGRFGVNLRHLGLVRKRCSEPWMRAFLLILMCVRVCKNELNSRLRSLSAKFKLTFEAPFHALLVDFLNTISGVTDQSGELWEKDMPRMLREKFGEIDFLESDFGRGDDLKSRFSIPLVQLLLGEAMGALWTAESKSLLTPLEQANASFDLSHLAKVVYFAPVQKTDISIMEPRVSTAPLANWFDGRARLHQAYVLMENLNLWPSLRVLESARVCFTQHDPNVEMLVDAIWSTYLSYQVRNELEPDANLRPVVREMIRLLVEIEAMGVKSKRFLCLKILVALSDSILHRNSVRLYSGNDWLKPEVLREMCGSLPTGDALLVCTDMTAVPLEIHSLRFAVLILRRSVLGSLTDTEAMLLLKSWVRIEQLAVDRIIEWANLAKDVVVEDKSIRGAGEIYAASVMQDLLEQIVKLPKVVSDFMSHEAESNPHRVALMILGSFPWKRLYTWDEKNGTIVTCGESSAPPPSTEVINFVSQLCVGWKFKKATFSAPIVISFLEVGASKVKRIGPIRTSFNSRRVNCLLCVQPMPVLTELCINSGILLDFLSLRAIIGCSSATLCRVSLCTESGSVMTAADLRELCELSRLESLTLYKFDFSEGQEEPMVQVLSKFCETLVEFNVRECYFGQLGAGVKLRSALRLNQLYFGTNEPNASFLEELLHASAGTLERLGVAVDAACSSYPETLRLKRLRVDTYPEPLQFFSAALERVSMRTNIAGLDMYAGAPFASLRRAHVAAAQMRRVFELSPQLSSLRCRGNLDWVNSLSNLTELRAQDFRDPFPLDSLLALRRLILEPARTTIKLESPILCTMLRTLHLRGIDFGRDVNAKLSTVLLNNPQLVDLKCNDVKWLSHQIFNAQTRKVFTCQLKSLVVESDGPESFQFTIFVKNLLDCPSLALTYLSLADLRLSSLKLLLSKLRHRFPKISIEQLNVF